MIRHFSQWFIVLATGVVLAAVLIFNHYRMEALANRPAPVMTTKVQPPDVVVITAENISANAQITGYGAAHPHFELTLTAQVAGQVVSLADTFESGQRVTAGEVLIQLEDSDYVAAVTSAQKDLATANLDLLEEQRQGLQANAEWEASGLEGVPESELVLRQPHLAVAQAAVVNAEAALAGARRDLGQTRIVAPFNALVVERLVAPGSYVQAGTELATLYSSDRVEVAVALSARDWTNLPDTATLIGGQWQVKLTSVEDGQSWFGRVDRVEQHLDGTTRQRSLIVAVDQPLDQSPALLNGTFLKVELAGRRLDSLWQLPSSALSQQGEIWYVKDGSRLDRFLGEPVFSTGDSIYLPVPQELAATSQQVLVHPLSSYLPGMMVHPTEEVGNE